MPDIVWKVVAEHPSASGVDLVVLVAVLIGPWALIRLAMNRKGPGDAGR